MMRPLLLFAGVISIVIAEGRASQLEGEARTMIPPTGRVLQLPIVPGEPPCLVSIDAWLPGTWSEPAYEVKEISPGSLYEVPAGTRVKNGQADQSETARRDIDRVVYALETALAFSDDMVTKTRGACRELGAWISVRLVRDDPDVNSGMYRADTNTVFLDMADLDGERYVAPDASTQDADLANRLARSQNIRTTLAHEIDHARGEGHDDPIPEEQHLFVGAPGLDENQVMNDLGFPLRRLAYGASDGVPYEAFGTRVFLRSAPTIAVASGDREAHRLEPEAARGFADLAERMVKEQRFTVIIDSDLDGLPDSNDPCPEVFAPAQRFGCEIPDGAQRPLPLRGVAALASTDPAATSSQWIQRGPMGGWPADAGRADWSFRLQIANALPPGWRDAVTEAWFGRSDAALAGAALVSVNTLVLPFIQEAPRVTTDQAWAAAFGPIVIPNPQGSRRGDVAVGSLRVPPMLSWSPTNRFERVGGADRFAAARQDRGTASDSGGLPRPSVKLFFTSLGESTGDAVRMTVVNDGNVPVELASEGFVLEPVSGVSAADVDRSLRSLAGLPRIDTTIKAYCRDLRLGVPPAGSVLRLAPDAAQSNLRPVQRMFGAAQRLVERGVLVPDVDRALYLDSIRQWSLWTLQERFTESAFVAAFIEHTRKNVVAAGERWRNRYQQEARALAAERWRAVQRVLSESQPK